MTIAELKNEIHNLPDGTHVYLVFKEHEEAVLLDRLNYTDTLSEVDSDDDSDMTDGLLLIGTGA